MPWEIVEQLLANPNTITVLRSFAVGTVRAVFGYLQHYLTDEPQPKWSWREFFGTWFRIVPQALGLGATGLPPESALITDVFVTKAAKAVETIE